MFKQKMKFFAGFIICLFFLIVIYLSMAWTKGEKFIEQNLSLSIEHGSFKRNFVLHLPKQFIKSKTYPLLVVLHGGGGTPEGMIRLTNGRFNELADKYSFIVAYPEGLGKSWNDERLEKISFAHKNKIDDVGFIFNLIKKMVDEYKADARRVFVTGISNGGFMSIRVSRELADIVKGIAPVCASIPFDAKDAHLSGKPINVMIVNGTADPLVPYNGGYVEVLGRKRGRVLSTDETVKIYLKRNNLKDEPEVKELEDRDHLDGTRVIRYEWKNSRYKVVLLKIVNGGHTWPGGLQYLNPRIVGRTSRDINCCDEIWEFFNSLE